MVLDDREVTMAAHERVVEEYREALARPAEIPDFPYEPVRIGPTWEVKPDGHWKLPERSLGWDVIGWAGTWLQHSKDVPWRYTLEQARFLLWWYALDEAGDFLFKDGVLQRIKGWGKDPLGACILATELLGPCRFLEWSEGEPIAQDRPQAWVQTCAVSLEQTKNTMRLFPSLFTAAAKARFELQIGKEQVYALNGARFIQAHTSSPTTMEGNRVTAVLLNETQHWNKANDGHEMASVVRRNLAKAPDAGARSLRITNAYSPGLDSVAERDREAWEKVQAGTAVDTGLLYDSLEASESAPLTAAAAPLVVPSVRGDSHWLQANAVVKEILDIRNPVSETRRFWYNQIWAAEDAWVTPQQWDACRVPGLELAEKDMIVMFFDGSKSEDSTGLVACRIDDGATFLLGCWQRPEKVQEWNVPRADVDAIVRRAFALYDVVGFLGDPGAGEDETGQRYWDAFIDGWSADFTESLCVKSVEGGADRHAVMWDMRSPARVRLFTEACERALADILEGNFPHDGHYTLRDHVRNARRRPNQWGVSIGKATMTSAKKIDTAVCAIGARMLRRMYLALPEGKRRQKQKKARVSWA